jgi:uncharacterized protein YeaO (DUF488 family)
MIRHASIYDQDQHRGWRVLIMRRWPRGVRRDRIDVWLKDAAPSPPLLESLQSGLGWAAFEQRYRDEILHERPHVLDELRALEHEHGTLTLLCHERIPPSEHCHRVVLCDLLKS